MINLHLGSNPIDAIVINFCNSLGLSTPKIMISYTPKKNGYGNGVQIKENV